MTTYLRRSLGSVVLALLALGLAGCRTLEYRSVQTAFETAVRSDNAQSPFISQFEPVVSTLTTNYIAGLAPALQPNAWMIRSVSAWRSEQFDVARTSAQAGLQWLGRGLDEGSRDHIVLIMIDGLANDGELGKKWVGGGKKVATGTYPEYREGYQAALVQLQSARKACTPRTPVDVREYCTYQEWRVIRNWEGVVGSLDGQDFPTASAEATRFLTDWMSSATPVNLTQAADAMAKSLTDASPLRAIIRAQSGR